MKEYLTKIMKTQKQYYRECQNEINGRNLQLIKTIGLVSSIVYVVYFIFTLAFFKEKMISPLYSVIVPIMLGFWIYSKRAIESENTSKTPLVTILLYIVTMTYIVHISVFSHPDIPAVYFPLYIMIVPVIFMMPFHQHIFLSLVSLGAFVVLVILYKEPQVWNHELFEAATAEVFSIIAIIFMAQYRIQSDSLKTKYYEISREDRLTGVMNKSAGQEAIINYLENKPKYEIFAIAFIDIDNFKYINDHYGHVTGDEILRTIGERLSCMCRDSDIICRFGGDEFIIALTNIRTKENAKKKATQIINELGKIKLQGNQTISCSIGIAMGMRGRTDFDEIIKRADAGLYIAKKSGKNCYAFSAGE